MEKAIEKLIKKLRENYDNNGIIDRKYDNKIIRGHKVAMSSIIENELAIFLSEILDEKYQFLIDWTVNNRRPDLLIINTENNKCELIIEIKSNMGYCRKLSQSQLNDLVNEREMFKNSITIKSKESNKDNPQSISGNKNIKLIFVSSTSDNSSEENHITNKKELKKYNIEYFCLFEGWYDNLKQKEIQDFIESIKKYGLKFK